MPLVKVSTEQLEAAQGLYTAASKLILCAPVIGNIYPEDEGTIENKVASRAWKNMVAAVTRCKEEYEKHG